MRVGLLAAALVALAVQAQAAPLRTLGRKALAPETTDLPWRWEGSVPYDAG